MQAPFDIAADLDTPVSTYLKLRQLDSRFLLESVERGEQLARFSFLGLGSALEIHLDSNSLSINGKKLPKPCGRNNVLNALRQALSSAPELTPYADDIPFRGGLVGYADFDLIHDLEQFPKDTIIQDRHPGAAYMAPRSLLIFDHLTRSVALLHSGAESERLALKKEIIQVLRGPLPAPSQNNRCTKARADLSKEEYMGLVSGAKQKIYEGDIFQIVLSNRLPGNATWIPLTPTAPYG